MTHTAHEHRDDADATRHHRPGGGETVKDPVCGMDVDPAASKHRAEYGRKSFHFCSAGCKAKFEADPARYAADGGPAVDAAPEGAIYTCPMHPEVRQVGPGACPICGMALEPLHVAAEAGANPELADMTRRFWFGLAFAAPLFVIEMGGHLFGWRHLASPTALAWIEFALATPATLGAGWPIFTRGWRSLVTRNLNMFPLRSA